MARPLAEIAEEIETNLQPLKRCGSNAKPEIEKYIAAVIAEAPDRARFRRALAIPRHAKKSREALNALRDSLPPGPPVFAEALQAIKAIDPKLAYLETLDGPDERQDLVKWGCADCAHALMRQLSTRAPSSSTDSPFRTVASLIFEAVQGNAGADLKRACDAVARSWPRELLDWNEAKAREQRS